MNNNQEGINYYYQFPWLGGRGREPAAHLSRLSLIFRQREHAGQLTEQQLMPREVESPPALHPPPSSAQVEGPPVPSPAQKGREATPCPRRSTGPSSPSSLVRRPSSPSARQRARPAPFCHLSTAPPPPYCSLTPQRQSDGSYLGTVWPRIEQKRLFSERKKTSERPLRI